MILRLIILLSLILLKTAVIAPQLFPEIIAQVCSSYKWYHIVIMDSALLVLTVDMIFRFAEFRGYIKNSKNINV